MSTNVTFNGTTYTLPSTGETGWGTQLSNFLIDVGNNAITRTASQTLVNKGVQLQAGSNAAPALTFASDTATGLYQPTTSQIALSTAGVQRLLVNGSGLVTIGNAAIGGGTLDATAIGSVTPSTIAATTIAATSTITSRAASGSVALNSDGTGRGYVSFANASSVSQGTFGYFNGTSIDLTVAGSATTINLNATTVTTQSVLNAGGAITSRTGSGSVALNSDGVGRGYVNFYNLSSVSQGTFGYFNGTSIDLNVAGSANTINLNAATVTAQSALTVGGNVTISGSITLNNAQNISAKDTSATVRNLISLGSDNNHNAIVPTTSTKWRVLNNAQSTELLGVTNAGVVTVLGQITASSNVDATGFVRGATLYAIAGSTAMSFGQVSSTRVLQYAASWSWQYDNTTGNLVWSTPAGTPWVMRSSDNLTYNSLAAVAGNGAYVNLSDSRLKSDIEPHSAGLDEVLKLKPVSFQRIGGLPRQEVGFLAHEVRDALPHAVRPIGKELADGTGGLDSSEPTLGIESDSIIAALVNAVKTLNQRLADIENRKR